MNRKNPTKRPNPHTLTPDFLSKNEDAQLRQHRLVVYLNDKELDALKRCLEISKKNTPKAVFAREAILEKVFHCLDENQPTLF